MREIQSKWPLILITGQPLTHEQTIDVIMRTDDNITKLSNASWGNNRSFFEQRLSRFSQFFDSPDMAYFMIKLLRKRLGVIELEYLKNLLISSIDIEGASAWIYETGEIYYHNPIGKYPTREELLADCKQIATAFPYIKMAVTVFDKESKPICPEDFDKESLMTFVIADGDVKVYFNQHMKHHHDFNDTPVRSSSHHKECFISDETLREIDCKIESLLKSFKEKL